MNPWQVLGIEPTADVSVIKSAYARELKLHRPQADPEGFQRVRDAYTHALALSKYGDQPNLDPSESQDEDEDARLEVRTAESLEQTHQANLAVTAPENEQLAESSRLQIGATESETSDVQVHTSPPQRRQLQVEVERLLREFDALLASSSGALENESARQWLSDPMLEWFDVRQALSHEVFSRTSFWLYERSERWSADTAIPPRALLVSLDRIFRWRDDEIGLERIFSHDEIERVFRVLSPERSTLPPQKRTGGWRGTLRWVLVWVAILWMATNAIRVFVSDPPGNAIAERDLRAAQAMYFDQKFEESLQGARTIQGSLAESIPAVETRLPSAAVEFEDELNWRVANLVIANLIELGRLEEALREADSFLADSPKHSGGLALRAGVHARANRLYEAVQDYEASLALQWNLGVANELAWVFATGDDAAIRNGVRAVELAQRVVNEQPHPSYIDTLAAAWAEQGDFAKAVETQRRAIQKLLELEGQAAGSPVELAMRARLAAFEQGQSVRDDVVQ